MFRVADTVDGRKYMSRKLVGKRKYWSPEIEGKHRTFDAKSNDIYCLGICLFVLIVGAYPFGKSCRSDCLFEAIVVNGQMTEVLKEWKRMEYVNKQLLDLFDGFFKFEDERVSLAQIKECSWLSDAVQL